MQSRFGFSAIVVASLLASTAFASAQGAGTDGVTGAPVTQMPSPNVSPPPATGTTGMGGGTSQPGAFGLSPGKPLGDAPGFPGKVGR